MEKKFSMDSLYINQNSLIIINPNGILIEIPNKGQKTLSELFLTEGEHIVKATKGKNNEIEMAQTLARNGYIVLIGDAASSECGELFYHKNLFIPKNLNNAKKDQKLVLKQILEKFDFGLMTKEERGKYLSDMTLTMYIESKMVYTVNLKDYPVSPEILMNNALSIRTREEYERE